MNRMTIRPAKAADASAIAEMLSRLAEDLGDGSVFASTSTTILRYGFSNPPMFHVVIAEIEAKACGFALYFAHFSTTKGKPGVYVQDLWIDPDRRGDGIGGKLLAAVASHAATDWAAAYLKLTVHADNPNAARFYNRLGLSMATNEIPMTAEPDTFAALQGAV